MDWTVEQMREFATWLECAPRFENTHSRSVKGPEFVRISGEVADWFAELVREQADRIEQVNPRGVTMEQTEIKIENLQRVQLEPGDVLVIRCKDPLPQPIKVKMVGQLQAIFPGHTVIVLDRGEELSIIGADK